MWTVECLPPAWVTSCEISYPCLIHSACDTHCASGCDSEGEGKCDSDCVDGYGLEATGHTCVGEYIYVTIFLINVVSQKHLLWCVTIQQVFF